jgi:hypothetical protein
MFPKAWIKSIAQERLKICKTCVHFDPTGDSGKLFVPGKPGCTICGCNATLKTHCLSCNCALPDIGEEPLWKAVMSQEAEDTFKFKAGISDE